MIEAGRSPSLADEAFFREMEKKDIPEVDAIERGSFRNPWPTEALLFELEENAFCNSFVVEVGGRVAAYAFLWVVDEDSHLVNIAVDGKMRRAGLGGFFLRRLIMFAGECAAKRMRLEVRAGNEEAVSLYLKFGFRVTGREKSYYSDGEDALVMLLTFGEQK
ncbi:MAG TPA: ribosomal protein S18-alanine N-acetyltransferase [Acidobacteriota bacterium]|mgnify:FL=1|nr:ribosomal protein S18-alanine N-acetyltransferase [Acidobacteriota bacterium]